MDCLMEKRKLKKTVVSVADVWRIECGRHVGAKGNIMTNISVAFLNRPRPHR